MKITEKEFEDLLIKNAVDCDASRDWIDSDFATVFKVVESLVEKASNIHNVSVYDDEYILTIRDHSNDNYIGANKSPEYLLERENMGNPKRINLVAVITE